MLTDTFGCVLGTFSPHTTPPNQFSLIDHGEINSCNRFAAEHTIEQIQWARFPKNWIKWPWNTFSQNRDEIKMVRIWFVLRLIALVGSRKKGKRMLNLLIVVVCGKRFQHIFTICITMKTDLISISDSGFDYRFGFNVQCTSVHIEWTFFLASVE